MDLVIGMIIGGIYVRNANSINERLYADACRLASLLSRTQIGFGTLYVLETILEAVEQRRVKITCMHSIMCDCRRRHCPGKTVSIGYYARKLKAAR